MEVEEERGPGGGLVFRHTGNDGDVDLGITREREERERKEIESGREGEKEILCII